MIGREMRFITLLVATASLALHCGFLSQARVSEAYIDEFGPNDATECLVTWPIHAIALPITATIDQTVRTIESTVPAGRDAVDLFLLDFSDNNVMLSRTVALPKLIITPVVFVGSYLARWFVPIEESSRLFGDYRPHDDPTPLSESNDERPAAAEEEDTPLKKPPEP